MPAADAKGAITILDFWADWCGICRLIDPVLKRIAGGRDDVVLQKVNVAEAPEMAETHNVRSLPTLVFLSEAGGELHRLSGTMTGRQIEAAISEALGRTA